MNSVASIPYQKQLSFKDQKLDFYHIVGLFVMATLLFMTSSTENFDILNPFKLPGSISQYLFYGFGLFFIFTIKANKSLKLPFPWFVLLVWVAGLFISSFIAVKPKESFAQSISFGLFFLTGYGIFKLCLNEKIQSYLLKIIGIIGLSWSFFILNIYFKYGYLPYKYKAAVDIPGHYSKHFYGLLILNGNIALLYFLSNKKNLLCKILRIFILSVNLFAIFISEARASLLIFIIISFYYLYNIENIRKKGKIFVRKLWAIFILLLVFFTVLHFLLEKKRILRNYDITNISYQEQRIYNRPKLLLKGLILIITHPAGIGGSNITATRVEREEFRELNKYFVHNQYLTTIAEAGWIVIFTLIILIRNMIIIPLKWKWKNKIRFSIFCVWLNFSLMLLFNEMIGVYYFLIFFLSSAIISAEK